ncbi:MAG: phosphopantetheine-binding protein [Acidimicrobiales bacterium]
MTDAEIAERVREVIAETLDLAAGSLLDDAVLAVDLGVDSLAATELALVIEDEFAIRVPQDERVDIVSVGDVIAMVRAKLRR